MARDPQAPLWTPSESEIAAHPATVFRHAFSERLGRPIPDFPGLQKVSVDEREAFWSLLWDMGGVIGDKGERVLGQDSMPGARFFPDAQLNFAETVLAGDPASEALVFRGEDKIKQRMTRGELNALVSQLQQGLFAAGVGEGDRVAAMLPNLPISIALMLATASIGAIFSSCSPDFGAAGVLDRFGQIEPTVFVAVDGYWYNGKQQHIADKVSEIVAGLPSARAVLIVDYLGMADTVASALPRAATMREFLRPFSAQPVTYLRGAFDRPLYILFSSGTTGKPKCIVHGQGGVLLQHIKEHRLHCGIGPSDRVFYFSTLGWMMWNWLLTGLATGATLLLYDGSPFAPGKEVLFDYAVEERMTVFGTSAKYIDALKKSDWAPRTTHDLSALRLMTSTGSPLAAESFDYVVDDIRPGIHLASISGGTDIAACFVLGDPTRPVYRGEIQTAGLGMSVDVWADDGTPSGTGMRGELVCTKAFPSMPVMFWNDADGSKYRSAYFERFPGVWCHGDFAEWTPHGGMIIHGRSDATLNPGGVRIGTAEIYAQVEQVPEVLESICIGQEHDSDVRVILFVRLRDGAALDRALSDAIKHKIRTGASPRHVPAKIIAIRDIPRTRSGKITELAVRDVVHGREVKNIEALANPEALALYKDLPELSS
jgi:acetoacetyl-CoA synthetase